MVRACRDFVACTKAHTPGGLTFNLGYRGDIMNIPLEWSIDSMRREKGGPSLFCVQGAEMEAGFFKGYGFNTPVVQVISVYS